MSQSPRTGRDECPRVQGQEEIDVPKSKGRQDGCQGQAGWMSRSNRWMSHLIKKKGILLRTFLLFRFSGDLLNCPCWWGPSLPHILVQSFTPFWNTFIDTPTHNVPPNMWASLSTSGRCTILTIYPTEGNSRLKDNSWVYLFLIMWERLILEILNWIVSLSGFTCQCDLTN